MLVVDKPLGWTSTDVVRKVKFMLRHNGLRNLKVGHAGTLDPLATGVLVVCLGKATKSVEALQAEEKEYVAEMETRRNHSEFRHGTSGGCRLSLGTHHA